METNQQTNANGFPAIGNALTVYNTPQPTATQPQQLNSTQPYNVPYYGQNTAMQPPVIQRTPVSKYILEQAL